MNLDRDYARMDYSSLLLYRLLGRLVGLVQYDVRVVFSVAAVTVGVSGSQGRRHSDAIRLGVVFFQLGSYRVSSFFGLLVRTSVAVFGRAVPYVSLLFFSRFRTILPHFLFFEARLLLFCCLAVPHSVPSVFHSFCVVYRGVVYSLWLAAGRRGCQTTACFPRAVSGVHPVTMGWVLL